MFQGRVCRYNSIYGLLLLLLLLLFLLLLSVLRSVPLSLSLSLASIRCHLFLVIDFISRSMRHLVTDQPRRRSAAQIVLTLTSFVYASIVQHVLYLPPFFPSFCCPSSLPPLPYSPLVLTLYLFLPFFLPYSAAYVTYLSDVSS